MRLRRSVLVSAAVPIGLSALVGLEVVLAMRGPRLPPSPPYELDGRFGGSTSPGRLLDVVWIGDSTATGVGASSGDGALPRQVLEGLEIPASLTVLGRSGARVSDAVADQLTRLSASSPPQMVVVGVGSNDVTHLTPRGRFRRDLERLLSGVRRAAPASPRILVLGIPDFGAVPLFAQPLRAIAGWRGRQLDADIRAVAAEEGAVYVDIAGPTGPHFRRDPDRYYAADGFHPNDAGYGLWADAVLAEVLPLVR